MLIMPRGIFQYWLFSILLLHINKIRYRWLIVSFYILQTILKPEMTHGTESPYRGVSPLLPNLPKSPGSAGWRPEYRTPTTHPCRYCQKSFQTNSHLNTHLRIHLNVRPFRCRICGLSSVQKGNLLRHLLRIHGVEAHSQNMMEIVPQPP